MDTSSDDTLPQSGNLSSSMWGIFALKTLLVPTRYELNIILGFLYAKNDHKKIKQKIKKALTILALREKMC